MCQATDKQIIEVLKMETIPALGCTEPVACALACARCKEHKHKVVAAGCVRRSFIVGAVKPVFLVKAAPALALAVYNQLYKRLTVILFGNIGLVGGVTVRRADNRLTPAALKR